MTFSDAVRSGFEHYVIFDGRASRPEFWWWVLFAILVSVVANIIDAVIGPPIVTSLAGLALLLPGLSVSIRRLHDTNRSGWWILIVLIPLIGWIVLLVFYLQDSDPAPNNYGPPPGPAAPAPPAPPPPPPPAG